MPEITPQPGNVAWASLFASEWLLLAEGHGDYEDLLAQGFALYRVVGSHPAKEIADIHFKSCSSDAEELVRDPAGEFEKLAMNADILMRGDKLDPNLQEFAFDVVELCAATADEFGHPKKGNAGDRIRSLYGRLPF